MMDYNKLTVVEIRALLKERGIPATGLTRKQQLIERLTEADSNEAGNPEVDVPTEVAPADILPSTTATNQPKDAAVVNELVAGVNMNEVEAGAEANVNEPEGVAVEDGQEMEPVVNTVEAVAVTSEQEAEVAVTEQEEETVVNEPEPKAIVQEPTEAEENATPDVMQLETSVNGAGLAGTVPGDAPGTGTFEQSLDTATSVTEPANSAPVSKTREQPTDTNESIIRTPDEKKLSSPIESSGGEESRKRKRRSLTPAVSSQDVARKRFKDEKTGVIHLEEDLAPKSEDVLKPRQPDSDKIINDAGRAMQAENVMMVDNMERQDLDEIREPQTQILNNAPSDGVPAAMHNYVAEKTEEIDSSKEAGQNRVEDLPAAAEERPASPKSPENISKDRPPKGQRYKTLFATPDASTDDTPNVHNDDYNDDRTVAPSIHSATTAVYIRDFMRPLHPNTLKDHLAVLAEGPSQSASANPPDPDKILVDFHLDSIRTHCFAVFNSLAAAARVRSALHERVWPAERDRKPLWVDFVPEEKVHGWIETEQNTGGRGRGAGSKRWEVIYERSTDDGSMNASLQEVGMAGSFSAVPTGPRRSVAAPPTNVPQFPPPEVRRESTQDQTGRGAAPSSAPTKTQPTSTKPQSSSFLALDSLFKSTAAKPKLYFLPVDKERASKRLDELDSKTRKGWSGDAGGGRGAEMTRFTFEDGDVLVDNGPEFGMRNGGRRGRGGGRGGGGLGDEGAGGGGYRSRGGGGGGYRGYRGEARYR